VRVTLAQLGPIDEPTEVVLGGGVVQAPDGVVAAAVRRKLVALETPISLKVADVPPVTGAVLHALDAIEAPAAAKQRARRELTQRPRAAEALVG
jgi:hypothetical protein